ncbi:MAG TPA: class I SAM-dependent DNA methyltransferase [Pseudomonas xinjiangensis]|uniref:site-specific DNA-methyltransferase (adenine-specific) n=2 Tax=root TaxID=1 RepID=A0A7V1FQT4_9GAMM|nr:class I SAM-dependent DNA methyltransferase [Halopseudomonas xinjiangensis]HEC48425.1 class I SAM-dependent DNA methyltransferase [Halopseudomonas xinjiangensis]
MNAVEIESAISDLALEPFDASEFAFTFLAAFGNKETTLKRLRAGNNNSSDVPGGVLLRSNIHIATCESGAVGETLKALRASSATIKGKAKFILATDGQTLEAEELVTGETIACDYQDFPNHFGFLLPLAGISTIKEIKDNPIDVRATSRLNKLYVELLNENPDWAKAERRHDMNHFMSRLVFCFFAEDTDIFTGDGIFTKTVEQFSERDGSNADQVLSEIFRAMNIRLTERACAEPRLPGWANKFPYVNGGLFSGSIDVPHFTRIARTYLLHAGKLNWQKINPDIFGSMIQAVADDEERGALGMHYTSVPNILKVLNPLFLDDLRTQLEAAGDNRAKLLNLRKRMARIRVFDPACGSGNFLVIAYKQMREIEAEINRRRGEAHNKSEIPLTNFRGIELRDFPAEIARLALIIAEFQCDVLYRGQQDALAEFLPLNAQNWIVCGNALRLDWLSICPATGTEVKLAADDLFSTPLNQTEIGFENEGGETYICGNPPFKGARKQSPAQKDDMAFVFGGGHAYKDCDYVTAWYLKASQYSNGSVSDFAFVSTNSIARGEQVEHLWSNLYENGDSIFFCHTQFKWQNNATQNAGVWCVIVGVSRDKSKKRRIFNGETCRDVQSISPYLISGEENCIEKTDYPISNDLPKLVSGNMARDGGNLILDEDNKNALLKDYPDAEPILRPLIGTTEIRQGSRRWCVWIEDEQLDLAGNIPPIKKRIENTRNFRMKSTAKTTIGYAKTPHKFAQRCHQNSSSIAVPKNTVEGIEYLTPDFFSSDTITTDLAFVTFTEEVWVLAVISSTLHRVWAEAISGGLGAGIRYSSQITYNAFPMPLLTEQNKVDLTICAEDILLAREACFPATIADLYATDTMPDNLRHAHERNDEVLERIYIGRRFKNDSERLEKLFELYAKMRVNAARGLTQKPRDKNV